MLAMQSELSTAMFLINRERVTGINANIKFWYQNSMTELLRLLLHMLYSLSEYCKYMLIRKCIKNISSLFAKLYKSVLHSVCLAIAPVLALSCSHQMTVGFQDFPQNFQSFHASICFYSDYRLIWL